MRVFRGIVIASGLGLIVWLALGISVIKVTRGQDCTTNPRYCYFLTLTPQIMRTNTPTLVVSNTPTMEVTSTVTLGTCVPVRGTTPCPTASVQSTATLTPAPVGSWVEDWSQGTSRWISGYSGNVPASSCAIASNNVLSSTCGAVSSIQRWDQTKPITVTGQVRGQPQGDSINYFCGLVLMQDPNIYAQTAVGRGIAPVNNTNPFWSALVWWADEYTHGYYHGPQVEVDSWQNFRVSWDGINTWSGSWNGTQQPQIYDNVTLPLEVVLQGQPQGPGDCQFNRIIVVGTRVN